MGASKGCPRKSVKARCLLLPTVVMLGLFLFYLMARADAEAEPEETPEVTAVEETTAAPATPVAGQEEADKIALKRLKLLLLLLMLTTLVMVLLLAILILSLRYRRYTFLLRKPRAPTELVDVWWLASPKDGKPVEKKKTPPENS